ncbi:NADH:ubiquinone oxidoreductase subunit [Phyllobacterium ifriqiyense]|uniref:NADH:ubiquinone oxidoreductase subunit n=1 Tax=Phyllobacterium ifriqiyense TaxID=314238 RepID=A0ABU0SDI7_9HYPH|nr:NADH:ubiquinone oxidoreductase subunit NDUFA12 [Phyllobacterium ifriqiyense]MDQ0998833.1 NADH:ubiquinone oxidoreductase subunit [Phyllobacterium ifriqiyense]
MKNLITQIFTWWNGQTIGTRFFTWRKGTKVGEDQFGNVYYEGTFDSEGRKRRWVIYNGYAEASAIPAGWHGWMHHRVATAPSQEDYKPHPWEKNHQQNLTGSSAAYRPKGSIAHGDNRPTVTGDYDAWTPGS